jgi:hypothetical protein
MYVVGDRDDADRVGRAGRAQVRALERVDRDVDLRRVAVVVPAVPDLLADEQHRRLVALALADHDGAAEVHHVERAPHRLDGDVVGELAVAAPHEARRCDRRGLGDADHFEREVAVLHAPLVPPRAAQDNRRTVDSLPERLRFVAVAP